MASAPECREWQGHVIVCGLQGVGLRTVEQLHLSGARVVVVDDDPDNRLTRLVAGWGVPHILGDGRHLDALEAAGLGGASAVICAQREELHKLETALRIHELRPDVPVVTQLANPSVGGALERVTGDGSVLDAAELAAPSFVEACLQRRSFDLDLGGQRFRVAGIVVPQGIVGHDTFRGHFGNLAPVAIVGSDEVMAICPGRDHPTVAGDRVTVLGSVDEVDAIGLATGPLSGFEGPAALGRFQRSRRRMLAMVRSSSNRAFPIAVAGLFLLMVLGAVVVHAGYRSVHGPRHLGVLTSVYFTVETISTVGYGDYSFAHQPTWFVIFGIALIVLGVLVVSTVFALFTNLLVSRRIEQSLGTGRVPGMTGHVIVVGFGAVGLRVAEGLLAEGVRVVVVERDRDNRYLDRARALGVPVVIADSTQSQTFKTVNLDEAVAMAVLTSNDLTNIETGLAARQSLGERWDDVPVVLRVFDRDLAHTVEASFGFHHVRSTSALAAPWFVGAALGLDVLQTFYVEHQPFLVGRITVTAGGGLEGVAMVELGSRVRVVALSRAGAHGRLEHPPRRDTRFAAGDQAYVLGPYEELLGVLRRDSALQAGD